MSQPVSARASRPEKQVCSMYVAGNSMHLLISRPIILNDFPPSLVFRLHGWKSQLVSYSL
eukprot:2268934-Amphidinium_carterae.1